MTTEAPPSYVSRTLTAPPGGSVETVRTSDYVTCLEADVPFRLSIDNSPATDFEAGLTVRLRSPANRFEIINPSDRPLTVRLGLGRGDVRDSRLVLGGDIRAQLTNDQLTVRQAEPVELVTVPAPIWVTHRDAQISDAERVVVLDANPQRVEVGLQNLGPGDARINPGTGWGPLLAEGQAIHLQTQSLVRCYGHGHVSLAIWELVRA